VTEREDMPKLKTNSGAKKRFRLTKSGKVKYRKAYARHLFTYKAPKRKLHNRGTGILSGPDEKRVKQMLPYGAP